jgi:hypothetical protein
VLVKSRWTGTHWFEQNAFSPASNEVEEIGYPIFCNNLLSNLLYIRSRDANNSSRRKKNMPYNTQLKKVFYHFIREAADHLFVLSIIHLY